MDVVVSSTEVAGADVDNDAGSEGVEPPADTGADADASAVEEESLGACAGAGFSLIMLCSAMARSASSEDGSVDDGLGPLLSSSGSSPSSNSPSSKSSFFIVQAIACRGQCYQTSRFACA
jgi:hypothetical protein